MKYDVVIIGSGPGGYVAAIRSSQLGFKTALVEKEESLGGTCLNSGCIPTKTLLELSKFFYDASKKYQKFGISFDNLSFDFSKMQERKDAVIEQNNKGINSLLSMNNVDVFSGTASFNNEHSIDIRNTGNSNQELNFDYAIIATGSSPMSLPFLNTDGEKIISSDDILKLKEVPASLIIVGAGVIGLEMASIFSRLGTKVSIFEIAPTILPNFDLDVCKELTRSLKKQGIKLYLDHTVESVFIDHSGVHLNASDINKKKVTIDAEYCLSAIGRKPNTDDLKLEKLGIDLHLSGAIGVNDFLQTNVKNIYAIGDVIGGAMLAHKASDEGIYVIEGLKQNGKKLNYKTVPSVVYTSPEIASVGYTEEELKKEGIAYKMGICQNRALGRAHTAGDLDGFAKVLISTESKKVMGLHLVAPHASEMVGEGVIAIEEGIDVDELARVSHAHPTFLEAIKEACMQAAYGKAIHRA